MRTVIFVLFVCCLGACSEGAGFSGSGSMDWTLFRGDASLSGYTNTSLPDKPVLKWTYKSDNRTVSSPVIENGTTYWCDKRGRVLGVDIDGNLSFEYNLSTAVEATPMIHNSILYVGRIDGFMTAISLTEKDTIWNYETLGQVSASPNLVEFEGNDAVVFGSYDNYLYTLDVQTGKELSKYESGYYLNGAAALWKEHVIFGGCDAWIRVIDCKTGISTDSVELGAYVPASPALMGDFGYVGDYSGNIYELRLKDGKIIDCKDIVTETDDNGSFVSVPAVSKDALYFFSGDRYLHAVNRKDGTLNWKYMLKGTAGESSPVICKDKVVFCTKTGIVSILDIKSGELLWEYDTGEQIVGSPAVIRNHFMVLTAKGTLFCFGKSA